MPNVTYRSRCGTATDVRHSSNLSTKKPVRDVIAPTYPHALVPHPAIDKRWCGARGIVVSAYGPDADPEIFDLVTRLSR